MKPSESLVQCKLFSKLETNSRPHSRSCILFLHGHDTLIFSLSYEKYLRKNLMLKGQFDLKLEVTKPRGFDFLKLFKNMHK